jgi:flagellin
VLIADTASGLAALPPFSLTTAFGAREAGKMLDEALGRLSAQHAVIGALQSRLETAIAVTSQQREDLMEARTRIVDTDVAEEATRLVAARILRQAGVAVLAHASHLPDLVLKLLGPT